MHLYSQYTNLFTKDKLNYSQILNYLILIYAFVIPISKAGVVIVEILLILLWLLQRDFQRKYNQLKSNSFFIALSLFLLLSIISLSWSSDLNYSLNYLRKYWHFLIIPIIYTSVDKKYVTHIFSAFLLGMLISEIVSYGIFFEIWSKEGISPNDPSPFMDHTNYSIYLAFTAFILMHRIFYSNEFKWKIIYGAYFLLSSSNLFLNGGRTGQVAFLASFFIVGFMNIKNKFAASATALLAIILIFFLAYNSSPIFKKRANYTYNDINRMITQDDFSGAFTQRVSLWILGSHQFMDNFLTGTGIGDEASGVDKYIESYNFEENGAVRKGEKYLDFHNAFIQYGVQLGIFGFILFVMIFYTLIKQKFTTPMYKNLNILFVSLFVFLSMMGLSMHIMASMTFFALFSALFLSISNSEQEDLLKI